MNNHQEITASVPENNIQEYGHWRRHRQTSSQQGGLLWWNYYLYVHCDIFFDTRFIFQKPECTGHSACPEPPSLERPLGTDELGRNILVRIIYGGRISLAISISAVVLALLIGVPFGLVSGYFGGKIDFIIQRITDVMLSFPPFLLALAWLSVLGVGLKNTIISVGIAGIPHTIRITRGCALSIREQVYVEAARVPGLRIVLSCFGTSCPM